MREGPDALLGVLDVSRETIVRLDAFRSELLKWQGKTNLVGPATATSFWSRHVVDAAFVFTKGREKRSWLDVGSGAGMPGLVIAALLADAEGGGRVASVEANAKKCAFQRAAVLAMGLRDTAVDVAILNQRLERLGPIEGPRTLTARAFAPLSVILDHVERLQGDVDRMLLLKGKAYATEIADARRRFDFDCEVHPHPVTQDSVLLDIRSFTPRDRR